MSSSRTWPKRGMSERREVVEGIEGISITAVIPTKNRPHDLTEAVRSLLWQDQPFTELMIIDQSPSAESRDCVMQLCAATPVISSGVTRLKYLWDPSIAGLTLARNLSLELITSEIVLFLDDDVSLEPDFNRRLLEAYARHPEADGISGIITNYERPRLPVRFWRVTFVRGPFRDERQSIYSNADRLRTAEPLRVRQLGGGLMSFRASAIKGTRFDYNLRGVADGEDVEFCRRLGPEKILLIAPQARLTHNASPLERVSSHWLRRHARSCYYLYLRLWNSGFQNRIFFYWLMAGYCLAAVGSTFRRASCQAWRDLALGLKEGRAGVSGR